MQLTTPAVRPSTPHCSVVRAHLGSRRTMRYLLTIAMVLNAFAASAAEFERERCGHDREKLLSLDEAAFDQDLPDGGWRKLGNIPGCEAAAADLIAAYRSRHPNASSTVTWHHGQMLASAGDNEQAIAVLEGAKKAPTQDIAGWNHYVDATVAFLAADRNKLEQARSRLTAVAYDASLGMPPLVDGYIEWPTPPGQPPRRMRWPPNVEVVDKLLACFGKPYRDALASTCQAP